MKLLTLLSTASVAFCFTSGIVFAQSQSAKLKSDKSAPPVSKMVKVSGPESCVSKNGLNISEITDLLSIHNKARSESGIPSLVWSCSLADMAQEWADRGVAEHRGMSDYGENIFVAASSTVSATDSVNRWLLEKPSWNNSSATCIAGKVCTHYTQVVWKRTAKVGCGINRNATGKWKVMLVCNYDPAGNGGGPPF